MRIFVTLTAAAALAVTLLGGTPASAATDGQLGNCPKGPYNSGNEVSVSIINNGCHVTQIRGAINGGPQQGHFHFWGPNGFSGDSGNQTWDRTQVATRSVSQSTKSGDLWCVAFIRSNGSQLGGNTCLTV